MKPHAAETLLASITALVPARVLKRLDAAPRSADAWSWSEGQVTTDSGECVTLRPRDGIIADVSQLQCSCLLSPRCFHVLAVAASLETADSATAAALTTEDPATEAALVRVDAAQRAVAERALEILGDWLLVGSSAAGAVLQGELLRVVHEARISGAARLGGAALRVVRATRSLRADRTDFSAHELLGELRELASTARLLSTRSEVDAEVLGRARREYTNIGSLRLFGVGCEPIVSRAGYAGVVSYVCDERGRLFTLNDVLPADPSRALGAYDVAIQMGDTSISHRELSRSGLFVQDAAASADGRLSAGKQVKAVRANAPSSLRGTDAARLFAAALEAQLDRAFAGTTPTETLIFVEAQVLGSAHGDLMVAINDVALRVVPAEGHPSLPFRENLSLTSELVGRKLLLVGHVSPERPRTLAAVTIEAGPDALALPEGFGQRINLGLDVLRRAYLIDPRKKSLDFQAHAALDPLAPLRRRLVALSLHGIASLPAEAITRCDAERAQLRKAVMPNAADALGALSEACLLAHNRRPNARSQLTEAFLAAASYEHSTTLALRRATFLSS